MLQSCSSDHEQMYYENFIIPAFSGSINLKESSDDYMMAKEVSYYLKKQTPPQDIYNFYNKELQKVNFQENTKEIFYTNEISDNGFIADGDWTKPPASFHKGWLDSKKSTVVKVPLIYKEKNDFHVGILVHPYVNSELLDDFLNYLKNKGEENEFYALLSKYPGSGHELDLVKALQKEPNNSILKKYAEVDRIGRAEMDLNYKIFNENLAGQNK